MSRALALVVVTGVDGGLIDGPAWPVRVAEATWFLERVGIPLVLCSQTTLSDNEWIRATISNGHPFIAENGAALYVPAAYFPHPFVGCREIEGYHLFEWSCSHAEVAAILHVVARELAIDIVSFADAPARDIAVRCHVPLDRAQRWKVRGYDEPFWFAGRDLAIRHRLARALRSQRLQSVAGDHVEHASAVLNRAASIQRLRTLFEHAYRCPVMTIGVGGSLSDAALLEEVDLPIIVRNELSGTTEALLRRVPTATVTNRPGSPGWSDAVMSAISTTQRIGRSAVSPRRMQPK